MRKKFLMVAAMMLLTTSALAVADDAIEFVLPKGTTFVIPKNQRVNATVDIKFPGEKAVRFGTADYKLTYKVVGGRLFMSFDPKKKPEAFGFGTGKVDIQAKIGEDDFETGTAFPVEYDGKKIVVELKPAK